MQVFDDHSEQGFTERNSFFMNELFQDVYGYEKVKKELLLIRDWTLNEEIAHDPKISIPHGVIFYGSPGNGKTLFMREYSKSFNAPIFTIEGKSKNIREEVTKTFALAREEKFAVVLIDEIELLIDKDSQLTRIFQAELDGINQKGRIFVMATANDVSMLNGALLRAGRFGKRIHIDYPDKKTRERLFEKFLSLFNIPLDNIDLNHIARVCASCNGASIKAIANDVYLRCRQNASTEDIEESYGRVVSHDACEDIPDNVKNMTVAIHEAGHALMTMHFKNDFTFYQAKYTGSGGITETYETNENLDTISKRESVIQISMAGYLAERVINGRHNVGSYEDYQKAFDHCTRLIERVCINGIKNLIPSYRSNGDRYESDKKRIANERQVIRLLKKYERKTLNFLKKNKEALRDFANVLFEKGKVTHRDILSFNNKENSSMAGSLISSFAHRYTDDKNQQVQI